MKDRITKLTNLEIDDSLSSFDGHAAQQHHNVYEVFYNFIKETKPKRILEIGTALGGFTNFLKTCCDELNLDTNIRTYDINSYPWYSDMINRGIDVRVENVFSNSFETVDNDVIDFIKKDGLTIVLCDGGWKIGEFNLLSNYIKKGDFIMAHDYVKDSEKFKNEIYMKIWNWHEISEKDIIKSCVKNGLVSYDETTFDNVVWVCKKKI